MASLCRLVASLWLACLLFECVGKLTEFSYSHPFTFISELFFELVSKFLLCFNFVSLQVADLSLLICKPYAFCLITKFLLIVQALFIGIFIYLLFMESSSTH